MAAREEVFNANRRQTYRDAYSEAARSAGEDVQKKRQLTQALAQDDLLKSQQGYSYNDEAQANASKIFGRGPAVEINYKSDSEFIQAWNQHVARVNDARFARIDERMAPIRIELTKEGQMLFVGTRAEQEYIQRNPGSTAGRFSVQNPVNGGFHTFCGNAMRKYLSKLSKRDASTYSKSEQMYLNSVRAVGLANMITTDYRINRRFLDDLKQLHMKNAAQQVSGHHSLLAQEQQYPERFVDPRALEKGQGLKIKDKAAPTLGYAKVSKTGEVIGSCHNPDGSRVLEGWPFKTTPLFKEYKKVPAGTDTSRLADKEGRLYGAKCVGTPSHLVDVYGLYAKYIDDGRAAGPAHADAIDFLRQWSPELRYAKQEQIGTYGDDWNEFFDNLQELNAKTGGMVSTLNGKTVTYNPSRVIQTPGVAGSHVVDQKYKKFNFERDVAINSKARNAGAYVIVDQDGNKQGRRPQSFYY